MTRKGGVQQMLRWGELRFEIDGEQYTLQAYRSDAAEERLFLPFRDRTNGEETYPAGRYLDLEPSRGLIADGTWIVDLNRAYNPWCAYSENYVCPFVLPENWLQVRIPTEVRSTSERRFSGQVDSERSGSRRRSVREERRAAKPQSRFKTRWA